ncbi:MAG: hypothetical protein AAF787_13575 [Chloroflexota bacterium]
MSNPLFLPLTIGLITIAAIIFIRGVIRFIRPLVGLGILALAVWYIAYLVRTSQLIVLVQPADPTFYTLNFIFAVLLWYGIRLLRGDKQK